jgi:hypothetical protein
MYVPGPLCSSTDVPHPNIETVTQATNNQDVHFLIFCFT